MSGALVDYQRRYCSCWLKWVNYLKPCLLSTMSLTSILSADAIDNALKDCQGKWHRLSCISSFLPYQQLITTECPNAFQKQFPSLAVGNSVAQPYVRCFQHMWLTLNIFNCLFALTAPDSFSPKKFFQLCGMTKKSPQEVKNIFNILDNDASGFIEEEELK